jgi:hypothetical protein
MDKNLIATVLNTVYVFAIVFGKLKTTFGDSSDSRKMTNICILQNSKILPFQTNNGQVLPFFRALSFFGVFYLVI